LKASATSNEQGTDPTPADPFFVGDAVCHGFRFLAAIRKAQPSNADSVLRRLGIGGD
jgi:hypothetical protein